MADFENAITDAIAAGYLPGCALAATNRDGSFTYSKSFGKASLKHGSEKPMELDSIMWFASCTKLMTSICALQLVERGVLQLDEPVYKYIPELENLPVLKGFTDAGEPMEEKHTQPITLRRLLTHSSGTVYTVMRPDLLAWLQHRKGGPSTSGKLLERFVYPLIYEPGESWSYGPSIDFAGLLIERATNQSLEDYMRANLWEPLGMTDVTFFPSKLPHLAPRMADMVERDAQSGKCVHSTGPLVYRDGEGNEMADCFGGDGLFTCAKEYIKVLKAVLDCDVEREGNVLSKASVDELFRPQLGEGSKATLNAVLQNEAVNFVMGGLPTDCPKDHSLGGVIPMADIPNGRKAGTMVWAGYPNIVWWIDRNTGLCGIFAAQTVPPGDAKICGLQRKFEEGMYTQLTGQKL